MIKLTTEEIVYCIEDKVPKIGEVVLVLIDDAIQDFHTQWFRKDFQKLPLRFHWDVAVYVCNQWGYPVWGKVNISGYGCTFDKYITHWKPLGTPPEQLKKVEYSTARNTGAGELFEFEMLKGMNDD